MGDGVPWHLEGYKFPIFYLDQVLQGEKRGTPLQVGWKFSGRADVFHAEGSRSSLWHLQLNSQVADGEKNLFLGPQTHF